MATALLVLLSLTSAGVLLRAEHLGYRSLVYVAKPLTLVAIGLIALFAWPAVSEAYRLWILVGLGFSLAGDIALMVPKDRFVQGLGAFLLAHLAYTWAFWSRVGEPVVLAYLPFAVAGLLVVAILWRHLTTLRLPVVVYAAAIATMAGTAFAVAMESPSSSTWLAASGALLFLFSDIVLGFNRFVGDIKSADALIIGTYFPGQMLIALSVFA